MSSLLVDGVFSDETASCDRRIHPCIRRSSNTLPTSRLDIGATFRYELLFSIVECEWILAPNAFDAHVLALQNAQLSIMRVDNTT
jgi:hypothetical protein